MRILLMTVFADVELRYHKKHWATYAEAWAAGRLGVLLNWGLTATTLH